MFNITLLLIYIKAKCHVPDSKLELYCFIATKQSVSVCIAQFLE